jgi:radical SAM protein with 4Fe4S-binding SPASM domain
MKRLLAQSGTATSCYFRSSVEPPNRKVLLQITERCNLHCAHCFVSAGNFGDIMTLPDIEHKVIPQLKACRAISVTLTGGEPFDHPEIINIVELLTEAHIAVSICSNATLITEQQMDQLAKLNAHVNVSLDGFSTESHGKFRGNTESFALTIETIKKLSSKGILQGLLATPNNLAAIEEYGELCQFGVENNASYVLMNPLSSMGRGTKSKGKLAASTQQMIKIQDVTRRYRDQITVVDIRFPNTEHLPLAGCEAGNIVYVFVHGELAICPYLVFAARNPESKHKPEEFIVGNILFDADIAERLDSYTFHERYRVGDNATCRDCSLESSCGKGCPAAVISSGQKIGAVDREVCPVVNPSGVLVDARA